LEGTIPFSALGGDHSVPSRFAMGQLVITPTAHTTLVSASVRQAIFRHMQGDWGELSLEDRNANETAVADGSRLFSAYTDRAGTRFWIITEADRSATTILMPTDY
jgi:hypothetical protein